MSKKYLFSVIALLAVALISVSVFTLSLGRSEEVPESAQTAVITDKSAEEPYCLLVAGKDRASGLTDVIMLVSFDPSKERISVLQLPRDTYSEYGSKRYNKLNGALGTLGGADELEKFFERALGITIDGHLILDLDGFRAVIDAVGGVDIELEEPLRYRDPYQNLTIDLPKGNQTLSGAQAEMLVRYRSGYARGDIDRLDVQKKFLAALFRTLKEKVSMENAYEVVSSAIDAVDTDVNIALAVALGLRALNVDSSRLCFFTLPGESTVSQKSGASYYVMSAKPTQRILLEYFGKESDEIDPDAVFAHPSYQEFIRIYQSDETVFPILASELENS